MKFEDIKSQEDFDKYVQAQVAAAVEAEGAEGLKSKNTELLAKLAKFKDIDPDKYAEMVTAAAEAEKNKAKSLEEQGEYKKLYEQAQEQHAKDMEKLQTKLDKALSQNKSLLVDAALSDALSEHNVNPVLLKPAISLLEKEVVLVDGEDGMQVAKVGDKDIASYVKEWAGTDVGKNFVLAKENSGGGAPGNGGTGGQVEEAEKHFQAGTWNLTKQAELARTDPDKYKELHAKYPSKDTGANTPQPPQGAQ